MAVAVGPADYFGDLGSSDGDSAVGDVDAEDEIEVVGLGGGGDGGEAIAVGAVETEGGETLCGYCGNVRGDVRRRFAVA